MKKNLSIFAILMLMALGITTPSYACDKAKDCSKKDAHCPKYEMKEKKCKLTKLKKKVKLLWEYQEKMGISDAQLDKIKDVKHQAIKKLIQLDADVKIIKVDLDAAMWKDMIDTGIVNSLIEKKYNAKEETAKVYVAAIRDIQKILDEKQRQSWVKILKAKKNDSGKCYRYSKEGYGKICPITGKPLSDKSGYKKSKM